MPIVFAVVLLCAPAPGLQGDLIFSDSFESGDTSAWSTTVGQLPPPPTITDFAPASSPVGAVVTVTGTSFAPQGWEPPRVSVNQQGGGTLTAPLVDYSATTIDFVIPAGADSGPITVSVGVQSATSATPLTILPSSDFTLSASPTSAIAIQGQAAVYALILESNSGFTRLATLSASGLPAGVTASFAPQQITAGQMSVTTLEVAAGQVPGAIPFTVSATASVDGFPLSTSVGLTLDVQAVTTSFLGRTVVDDAMETPLAGVTVSMLSVDNQGQSTGCSGQTVSDAAGNFALTDLAAACDGMQLIRYDGSTATSPPGQYAGVDLAYELVVGEVTVSPVLVHLPRIDNAETVMVIQNHTEDQVFTFETIPNLKAIVYAGTTLTLPDDTQPNPFPFTAVQVPIDRLPEEMPPDEETVASFIVAFQPANTTASQPVAVFYPNTFNTLPGINLPLSTLDPTQGAMVIYGTGTVANDGTQIIPDFDPLYPGRRYGIVNFDWHGPLPPGPEQQPTPGGPAAGGSVDLASGVEIFTTTDMAIRGGRQALEVRRTYRTLSLVPGPFGIGTGHDYDFRLDTQTPQSAAVVSLVLPSGNRIAFSRQANGQLVNLDTPTLGGVVMETEADGTARVRFKDGSVYRFAPGDFQTGSVLVETADANGNTITLTRDPARPARLLEIIDPVGRKLLLEYDGDDRVIEITDPIGRVVSYTYGATGRLATVVDPEGGQTSYEYNAQNHLSRITDPRGLVVIENEYDDNGRVVEQARADGGRILFEYTLANPLVPQSPVLTTRMTDPEGHVTTFRFNPQGYVVSVVDPLGQTRIFEREPGTNRLLALRGAGACSLCGDPGVGDETFTYDAKGNLLTHTDALGDVSSFTYEPVCNKIASFTDALGEVSRFTYDASGNLISFEDARGNLTTMEYNTAGQVVEVTDATGLTTDLAYDAVGNMVNVRDVRGNLSVGRYDAVSRLVEYEDPLGRRVAAVYDNLDRVTRLTDGLGRETSFTYDPVGNLLSLTNARGEVNTFVYDPMRRAVERRDALGRAFSVTYDLNGNLVETVDRVGQLSQYIYDALDRPVLETYDDGASVARSYDSRSRLIQVVDSEGGAFTFEYDEAGRLARTVSPVGTVSYGRDDVGQVTERQVLGYTAQVFEYDAVRNLTRVAMADVFADMTYDARNQRTAVERSNGVLTSYVYDDLGFLVSRTDTKSGDTLHAQLSTYDAAGQRTSRSSTLAQPLTSTTAAAVYDAADQVTTFGPVSYTYDANGDRLSESGPEGTTTYTWDARRRLQSITGPGGEINSFGYDFAGNLIEHRIEGSGPSVRRTFVLDSLSNLAAVSSDAGEDLAFLSGRGLDEHFATVDGDGQPHFALFGNLGNVVAVTDAAGQVEGQVFYQPYGETSTSGAEYPLQLASRPRVSDRLYNFRNRYYDTRSRRFISEDPAGFLGGTNLHLFGLNDPVNNTDPLGLWTGYDDGIAIATGATLGVIGQAWSDLLGVVSGTGEWSGWEDYAGSAVGGAVAAEVLLHTASPIAAGFAGGAAGNATAQGLKYATGKQCGFDADALGLTAALGGIVGMLPISKLKVPGITHGRGSPGAVARQMRTKLSKGQVSRLRPGTVGKMVLSDTVEGLPDAVIGGAVGAGQNALSSPQPCK